MIGKLFQPPAIDPKKIEKLKYLLMFYLVLALAYEWTWTWYSINEYESEIQKYDEDPIWKREFFKSTRNLFIFCAVLTTLVLSLAIFATYRNSRLFLCISIVLIIMEWGFEFIGIYTSGDFNVFIYKIIGMVMRPGMFILAILHAWVMKGPESMAQ